ncbi:MarR family winged helix-turn-helix transcriptional regulator [Microbacterium hibisci]|uniref:MarR family winged helix-turn-helix transcriptional regulator n=1 Tax=Microbacterium hibisci TaxID=2036000 RepID=UPI0019423215|nr:MarR family winged helix-turn-helix transcriptional regulator [Microbacterium hibisci]
MSEIAATGGGADPGRPDVGALLERVRRADARIGRRRRLPAALSETDRAAIRFLAETGPATEVTTTMIVAALHMAAASGTALVDRLLAQGLVVVNVSSLDRRKKIISLVDDTMNPDDLDPITTTLRAIAARLTLSDAQVVAGFLEEVLATFTHAAQPPSPAKLR